MRSGKEIRRGLLLELKSRAECGWAAEESGMWENVRNMSQVIRGLIDAMRVTGLFTEEELEEAESIREEMAVSWLTASMEDRVWMPRGQSAKQR